MMKLLHRFSLVFDELGGRFISSHSMTTFHIIFVTIWLLFDLDLTVLALILSVEGVVIWTVVLKSTNKIREAQEKKDRFENKRFREFLENDIKVTEQDLKLTREAYLKLQDLAYRIEELGTRVESLSKSLTLQVEDKIDGQIDQGDIKGEVS